MEHIACKRYANYQKQMPKNYRGWLDFCLSHLNKTINIYCQ